MGGIAGKNTGGGEIYECKIAVEDVPEWASLKKNYQELGHNSDAKDTVITAWEKGKTASCGYVGGIAGFNEGSIHDIDCHDAKAVKVDAVTGNVGGMVGYQGSTGEIYQCTTGGKVGSDGEPWNIETINYQTDMAIGGVIGYNCSDKSVYSLTNRSSVTKGGGNNEFNNSAGGIMGRLESSVSSSRKIYNCVNEGSITGNARVGGIIGQWKYKGGVLSNCTNKA